MNLTIEDFKHYKKNVETDIKKHNEELDRYNSPEEVIAAFNGRFAKNPSDESMIENYLFVGSSTILPSLFYQMPRITIRSKRLPFEAAVLTAFINATYGDREKEENQLCIIDAFLPYGFAVMKNLYNSRTGKVRNPSILTGKVMQEGKENDMEGDIEYLMYEKASSIRQSPKKTYLDSTQPFGKGNRITFEYDRTLQQLIDSNLYNLSSNFLSYFKARNKDSREQDIKLTEHWIMKDGFAWKLCYVEGWEEELAWNQTVYTELPVSYVRFNKIGDVMFAVSHGTLGLRAQKELNYLNELWKKHIDNMRNQHIVDESSLTESGKATIKANDIGGIVTTTKPIGAGIAAPLQSASVDPALFGNINTVREYLKLILSTTGGKTGGPESELATTERNKQLGDVLRTSGIQDSIRDFMIHQIKQRIKNILRIGDPEMIVIVTGDNLFDPETGKQIDPGTGVQIGGDNGLILKKVITGDIDVDYIYDVDMQSAARPDFPVVRKQLGEGIMIAGNLEEKLRGAGKKVHFDLLLKDYFATFDAVPDADKYITDMTQEEKDQMLMEQEAVKLFQMMNQAGVPTEGGIAKGAGKTPKPQGVGP